jgi:hypothetical protein
LTLAFCWRSRDRRKQLKNNPQRNGNHVQFVFPL